MPSTQLPKLAAAFRKVRSRRALIEPGVIAEVPEGLGPIYPSIREFALFEAGLATAKFTAAHPAVRAHFHDPADLQALIDAYNAGHRFI